jgi:hypothetical protein
MMLLDEHVEAFSQRGEYEAREGTVRWRGNGKDAKLAH